LLAATFRGFSGANIDSLNGGGVLDIVIFLRTRDEFRQQITTVPLFPQ
jgi:hypothetical protein